MIRQYLSEPPSPRCLYYNQIAVRELNLIGAAKRQDRSIRALDSLASHGTRFASSEAKWGDRTS
jgi:hypothetical protein